MEELQLVTRVVEFDCHAVDQASDRDQHAIDKYGMPPTETKIGARNVGNSADRATLTGRTSFLKR